ncbi:hypothetical protein FMUND_7848 [Fusarium mundagurra]|uniref:Uncharacterized protein n=1 Tax=Fusarium mundagurra TaxID=1567541 RepID=A0A8H6DDI4_9HYPO|nr:hypothetical protein FMUND_7848 [Fusarium mundagurra]
MSVQLTIAVAALSVLIRLIGIYGKPFLKHTGDPGTHALLMFARNPFYLLNELMLADYPVPAIPSWPIFSIFYYSFHKQCIVLYLQDSAVRLMVNGIQALQKRSWSPFVNTNRQLDRMARKDIAKLVMIDEAVHWALAALYISVRAYRVKGAME